MRGFKRTTFRLDARSPLPVSGGQSGERACLNWFFSSPQRVSILEAEADMAWDSEDTRAVRGIVLPLFWPCLPMASILFLRLSDSCQPARQKRGQDFEEGTLRRTPWLAVSATSFCFPPRTLVLRGRWCVGSWGRGGGWGVDFQDKGGNGTAVPLASQPLALIRLIPWPLLFLSKLDFSVISTS